VSKQNESCFETLISKLNQKLYLMCNNIVVLEAPTPRHLKDFPWSSLLPDDLWHSHRPPGKKCRKQQCLLRTFSVAKGDTYCPKFPKASSSQWRFPPPKPDCPIACRLPSDWGAEWAYLLIPTDQAQVYDCLLS